MIVHILSFIIQIKPVKYTSLDNKLSIHRGFVTPAPMEYFIVSGKVELVTNVCPNIKL